MRYVKIFFLNFLHVFELRAKTFVYFLLSLTGPFLFLLFWIGAHIVGTSSFNFNTISSYYFLLIVASSLLMCHIENDIGTLDIQEGGMVKYLLKPFPYYWAKFLEEIPWRVLQAGMGLIVLLFLIIFFGKFFSITNSIPLFFITFFASVFAIMLSFTYKVLLGLAAFWLEDINGIFQLSEILIYIFAGFVVPLYVFPKAFEDIAYILPFSYMIYFPIAIIQGRLNVMQSILVLGFQLAWLLILYVLYMFVWAKGRQKFLGVGQ